VKEKSVMAMIITKRKCVSELECGESCKSSLKEKLEN
jgi:hypothetical protein